MSLLTLNKSTTSRLELSDRRASRIIPDLDLNPADLYAETVSFRFIVLGSLEFGASHGFVTMLDKSLLLPTAYNYLFLDHTNPT